MPKRIGVFLQLGTQFIRSDPRWTRLSDSAQALWITLEAIAVEERREFISAEWDATELAGARRRDPQEITSALEELKKGPRPLIYIMPDGRIRVVGVRKHHGDRFLWREESKHADSWNNFFATDETHELDTQSFVAVEITGRTGRPTTNSLQEVATLRQEVTDKSHKVVVTDVDVDVKAVQSSIQTRRTSNVDTVKQPSCHTKAGLDMESKDHVNGNAWHVDTAIHKVTESLILDWPNPGKNKTESRLRANLARGSPFHVLAVVRDISEKYRGKRKTAGKKIVHPWMALGARFKISKYSPPDTDIAWAKQQVEFLQEHGPPDERVGYPEMLGTILGGEKDE